MGQRILLTGASSGIGLETARLLTARGHEIWGTSRDITRLPQLPNFHPVALDLSRPAITGEFDVLINNAGAGYFGASATQPTEIVHEQFDVLFHGPLQLIRAVLPGMRARGRGLIINVSSLAARFPVPYLGIYSAAKAALTAFDEALRVELAGTPIRLVEIQPGDIHTPFHAATKRLPGGDAAEEKVWKVYSHHMKTAPPPARVARAIARVIEANNPPPVVVVGDFFQARLGPFLARFATPRMMDWFLRRYYGL